MDRLPKWGLCQVVHIGLNDAGDPWIPPGGLRIVHQHDRLPVVRHLNDARQQTVRQHFTLGSAHQLLPLQAIPHTVTLRAELPRQAPERILRGLIKLVILRPRQDAHAVIPQQLFYPLGFDERPRARPNGQAIAIFQQASLVTTQPHFQVGAEGVHDRWHVDTARNRQIAAHAAAGTIQGELLPGFHRQTPAGPDRCAVKVGVAARAGQGEPAVLLKFESTLPEGDLQRSIVRVIPHQQIADL